MKTVNELMVGFKEFFHVMTVDERNNSHRAAFLAKPRNIHRAATELHRFFKSEADAVEFAKIVDRKLLEEFKAEDRSNAVDLYNLFRVQNGITNKTHDIDTRVEFRQQAIDYCLKMFREYRDYESIY